MNYWDKIEYQRIKSAEVLDENIKILFDNGDDELYLIDRLLPEGYSYSKDKKIVCSEFSILIPATPEDIDVPWDKIRVLSDSKFGEYMANIADSYSKKIGSRIRALRVKKGIKSNEIATRTHLTPQTISRIETGKTDVSFSSLNKILGAMGCTLADLTDEAFQSTNISFQLLLKKLIQAGIEKALIYSRIIPNTIISLIEQYKGDEPDMLLNEAAEYVSNIFGWRIEDIWQNKTLSLSEVPVNNAFYKTPLRSNTNQIRAYSHYVYYLAKTILKSIPDESTLEFPSSTEDFIDQFYKYYDSIELDNLISYAWNLGICVLPLSDPGTFHGACWNIDGKYIIVLKQRHLSHARWIFDFLHELYHVFAHLNEDNSAVIEENEISPFDHDQKEEIEANYFANTVLFGSNFSELPEKCVKEANWDLKNLRKAVVKVSKKEHYRTDALANLLAFRLSKQGENWWGTANKLQIYEPNPYNLVIEQLVKRMNPKYLSNFEANIIDMSLT
jgi:transcriptional regulator with XRE-family HTH domain/Zn-dependent peptidase ImmA (M78 family)